MSIVDFEPAQYSQRGFLAKFWAMTGQGSGTAVWMPRRPGMGVPARLFCSNAPIREEERAA